MTESTLECGHCGGVAIESADGQFQQDDDRNGQGCQTCGMYGMVEVGEEDDDGYATAYWSHADDLEHKCKLADCEYGCREG
jgi:hypothetical protein